MQEKTEMAEQAQQLVSYEVVDAEDHSVGTVASVWVDSATGLPEFVAVHGDGGQGRTSIRCSSCSLRLALASNWGAPLICCAL